MIVYCIYMAIFITLPVKIVNCLGLDELDDLDHNYISSIVVHKSRAFLALPRSICPNNQTISTLIETHWDVGHHGDIFSRFSQKITKHKLMSIQVWGDCNFIQDAISLSMDPLKSKFWILDKGNDVCSPKIVSYNFVFNHIGDQTEFVTVDGRNLNVMVVDNLGDGHSDYRAYIGRAEENTLLVFSLKNLVWWKIHLVENSIPPIPVKADFLTISKVNTDLFITGINELEIFGIDLEHLRNMKEPATTESGDESLSVNVTLLGQKLGYSTGIESDLDYGLNYFMIRDHAIVRWNTRYSLLAEYHDVLGQSYESFPYISGFLTDPENSIWAILNPINPYKCKRTLKNFEHVVELENRAVRVIKYDQFIDDIEFEKFTDDDR